MVKIKTILAGVLVLIIAVLAVLYFSGSEEKKVRKQFHLLSEWVSKDPDEKVFTMAHKVQSIGTLFAEACEFKAPIVSLSGSYTPEEISSYAAQGRAYFSKLSLRFYDLEIDFPEEGVAKAILTAKLTGTSKAGEHVDEIQEFECALQKIEDRWLFRSFKVVEVLKR